MVFRSWLCNFFFIMIILNAIFKFWGQKKLEKRTEQFYNKYVLQLASVWKMSLGQSRYATSIPRVICFCCATSSCDRGWYSVVQYLSAGHFMTENILIPLIQLLYDTSTSVQVCSWYLHNSVIWSPWIQTNCIYLNVIEVR